MSDTIKGAVITGVLGIIAAIVTAKLGASHGEENAINQLNSQMATVTGDYNTVNINSVDDMVNSYSELINEKESLLAQNTEYFNRLQEVNEQLKEFENLSDSKVAELEQQLNDKPDIQYKNAGLTIDGMNVSVNSNQSIIIADGREYVSKELFEKVIPDDKRLTEKGDMLFIGKVIADQANLFEQIEFDRSFNGSRTTYKDSFGKEYPNSYALSDGFYLTYNLDRKYSMLDITLVLSEYSDSNREGYITVEADGKNVYSSPYIKKTTEPFREQIPIDNCLLLTIKFTKNKSNNSCSCIISDAIVYN